MRKIRWLIALAAICIAMAMYLLVAESRADQKVVPTIESQ
jgi:hypothetical protein